MDINNTRKNYAKRRNVILEVETQTDRLDNEFQVITLSCEFTYYGNTDIDPVAKYRIAKNGSLSMFESYQKDHDLPAHIADWNAFKPVIDYISKTFHEVADYKN